MSSERLFSHCKRALVSTYNLLQASNQLSRKYESEESTSELQRSLRPSPRRRSFQSLDMLYCAIEMQLYSSCNVSQEYSRLVQAVLSAIIGAPSLPQLTQARWRNRCKRRDEHLKGVQPVNKAAKASQSPRCAHGGGRHSQSRGVAVLCKHSKVAICSGESRLRSMTRSACVPKGCKPT